MTSFPPALVTASTEASTESTAIVFMVVLTSVFFIRPPLIPGIPSAPVVTIQYSMGPGHFSIFQPNTFLGTDRERGSAKRLGPFPERWGSGPAGEAQVDFAQMAANDFSRRGPAELEAASGWPVSRNRS